ncbi:MAG: glycosyltransferase [Arenicellales bacterium]
MIPNEYHFIFALQPQREPFHISHYLCLASCIETNEPEAVHLYYCYEPFGEWWERIKDRLTLHPIEGEQFVLSSPAYDRHIEGLIIKYHQLLYAHQSDFIRLKVLIERGGVYADIDTLFVNPLPQELFSRSFVVAEEAPVLVPGARETQRSLCNALIMAVAGCEFAKTWLERMYEVFDGTWSRHSCQILTELAEQYPGQVHIAPQSCFYKHPATIEGIRTLLRGLDDDYDGVYSMHLWQHLWWSPHRTDFTNFHNGLLDEHHIRTVDTTYNIVARRFLPAG